MLLFDKEKHIYKLDGITIPSVTQIIKETGLYKNYGDIENTLLKADLGEKVHKTLELYDNQNLDEASLHPILANYLEVWKKFVIDFEFRPIYIEKEMYHPLYRYAGCIDRVGKIKLNGKEELAVVDIKTGVPHHSHAIQTAAYMEMYNYNKPISEQVKTRICVYISENEYKIKEHTNNNDKNVFLASLTIYNYLKNNK